MQYTGQSNDTSISEAIPQYNWNDAKRKASFDIRVDTLKLLYWAGIGLVAYSLLPKRLIRGIVREARRFT